MQTSPRYRVRPALEAPPPSSRFAFGGEVGARLRANTDQWLLIAPDANPSMLQMLRDRDRTPSRDLVPWAGEFAGKYLTAATGALRLTGDRRLRAYLKRFVADLIACQAPDGYFGPFPASTRMTGAGLWDLWGQYHVMLGLLRWSETTGDRAALASARRCADHFCDVFLKTGKRVHDAGSEEMNESSAHGFALLFARTGVGRYRELLHEIERDWETPPSGDYVRAARAGTPFWKTPKPRWESLHAVQAVAELYLLTGDAKYREALEQTWWSIVEGDRHNTGGFSSGEQATGNPYDPRAIETCCTIAWMCLSIDFLRITGDPRVADELELSFWNAALGSMSPTGRWWSYNTPMGGGRNASAHDIVFQARAGSPELNCCSVNGPRALGMLAEWAVMAAEDGLAVNVYAPGSVTVRTPGGQPVTLTQVTDYPRDGKIALTISLPKPERFALKLRIPGWTEKARVDGQPAPPGYHTLARTWNDGETIRLDLDLPTWLWVGEREAAGKVSVYRGPLLLALDPRFDPHDPTRPPTLALPLSAETVAAPGGLVRVNVPTGDRSRVTLCDFASAGMGGNPYVTWLPAAPGPRPAPFSRHNPLRRVAAGKEA